MLSRFARVTPRICSPLSQQARFVSANKSLDKNELAHERDFINRREREMLGEILKKAENEESRSASTKALEEILAKHNVALNTSLINALKEWRATTY